ncbi:non-ribosomal peptide synthetase, partial [Dyella flagellata]
EAYARERYEAPQGQVEQILAHIWQELLGVERVGRHDNFFALGGHSLLAVQHMEWLRRRGLSCDVRTLFTTSTLCDLATQLGGKHEVAVPPNAISPDSRAITPSMLPLIELSQGEIDRIVTQVPGGIGNIQDIYALSPLQDGILFHHLLSKQGDPYLLIAQLVFADRSLLDRFLVAVQQVVNRHDILRTAFVWDQLAVPAQVVWRQACPAVRELRLDPAAGPIAEQLRRHVDPRHHRIDLVKAPLLHYVIAQDPHDGRWHVVQLLHHLIGDHSTAELLLREVQALLEGRADHLLPAQPFRRLIAQARLGVSEQAHVDYFRRQLSDIDEPCLPFDLSEVHRDGRQVGEAYRRLPSALHERLREQARRRGVSMASLCHLAWGQVVARTSGRTNAVFGTVLFGRMHGGEGADQAMGMFINTLPLRLSLDETPVEVSVQDTHRRLAELLQHEHASLALAQRCSGVEAPAPLFSALFNYRHNRMMDEDSRIVLPGIELLEAEERTNYPVVLSVEDFGEALGLTSQAVAPLEPERICGYMQRALESLVEALERAPGRPVHELEIVPEEERMLLLEAWNRTAADYPQDLCVHQLFERQANRTPDALAVIHAEEQLSYGELNAQSNRLAHWLIKVGVKPDEPIAICMARSTHMLVGLLGILKAGGAYVPVDPAYPEERRAFMLKDVASRILLTDAASRRAWGVALPQELTVLELDAERPVWADQAKHNPRIGGLTSQRLAYVIYTSGSTGLPKGVMVEHRQLINLVTWHATNFELRAGHRSTATAGVGFDASVWEIWPSLSTGGVLLLPPESTAADPASMLQWWRSQSMRTAFLVTPLALLALAEKNGVPNALQRLLVGGDHLPKLPGGVCHGLQLINNYGPTETTVVATSGVVDVQASVHPIGRPIANTRIYLLDEDQQPVPLGSRGEIYIGGAGVARGYCNRPALTNERFLPDPFSGQAGGRMYRTGDLAKYLPDGSIMFMGRNDGQVKIRGFRIEPGEIQARLLEHEDIREATVLAREDAQGEKRLVAYVVSKDSARSADVLARALRVHLGKHLPDYMVPSVFVQLDALPLTPNGKVDRKALPPPDEGACAHQAYEAPEGEIEQTMAEIWQELLDTQSVGRHDNFFALGGHSLLVVRLITRLQSEFGVRLSMDTLFNHADLASFSKEVLIAVVAQEFDSDDLGKLVVVEAEKP